MYDHRQTGAWHLYDTCAKVLCDSRKLCANLAQPARTHTIYLVIMPLPHILVAARQCSKISKPQTIYRSALAAHVADAVSSQPHICSFQLFATGRGSCGTWLVVTGATSAFSRGSR